MWWSMNPEVVLLCNNWGSGAAPFQRAEIHQRLAIGSLTTMLPTQNIPVWIGCPKHNNHHNYIKSCQTKSVNSGNNAEFVSWVVLSARIFSFEEIPPRAPNFMSVSSPVEFVGTFEVSLSITEFEGPSTQTKIYSRDLHPVVQYQTVNNLYGYRSQNKSCWKLFRLNDHEPKARSASTNASQKISELIENHTQVLTTPCHPIIHL